MKPARMFHVWIAATMMMVGVAACASTTDDGDCQLEGRCPNACADGIGVRDEICGTESDCQCGLRCVEQTCQPYVGEHLGCTCKGQAAGSGLPVLGNGSHGVDSLEVTTIGTKSDGLNIPRDLAFKPEAPDELWVVNLNGPSMVIFSATGTASQTSSVRTGSVHFFAKPAALAFGAPGTLATIHEEDQITQDTTPANFMGPTLWTSATGTFDAGHGAHLDMLHNTPNGAGIAYAGTGNTYFVFDGAAGAITRYAFNGDHGLGGSDHTDGEVARFVAGEVSHVKGIPAHLKLDSATSMLYIADTGNNRIAQLNVAAGTRGGSTSPNHDGSDQYAITGVTTSTFVNGADAGLEAPSGLTLHNGHVVVSDNATSRISAFAMDGGLVDYLDLATVVPAGGLMGIAFDTQGRLYAVDAKQNRVLRIAPK